MPIHPTHAPRLDELQTILREDYGEEIDLTEVAMVSDWLKRFYTAAARMAIARRVAEHDAASPKDSLLDNSHK